MPPDTLDPIMTPADDVHDNNNVSRPQQRVTKNSDLVNNDSDNINECHTSLVKEQVFKPEIIWFELIAQLFLHTGFLCGAYYLVTLQAKFFTYIWYIVLVFGSGIGVTAGAHRLWSHRSYKAKLPLRLILITLFTIAGQNTLYDWVRDHRVHHKYSETDADPHNSNRGFFFAHVGWLMLNKHPEVIKKGRAIDMSDVLNDPVIKFHQKFFIPLKVMLCFIIPTLVPVYFWGESWYLAFISEAVLRYLFGLNFTWLVNSAAHMWGYRSFDKRINPAENITVAILSMGEGWHNYHHVFPWDYKAAELGNYKLNITTFWIDMFAKIGWAYDLKEPSKELVRKVIEKHGDGSHVVYGHAHKHHDHPDEVPPPMDELGY
ncbi:unnamed protein product [Diamesa tonsa]